MLHNFEHRERASDDALEGYLWQELPGLHTPPGGLAESCSERCLRAGARCSLFAFSSSNTAVAPCRFFNLSEDEPQPPLQDPALGYAAIVQSYMYTKQGATWYWPEGKWALYKRQRGARGLRCCLGNGAFECVSLCAPRLGGTKHLGQLN